MKKGGPGEETQVLFQPFAEKMQRSGLPQMVIDTFEHYYALLVRGETGLISESEIDPVQEDEIADSESLAGQNQEGRKALKELVVIKLNGGLGTSMGLSRAKSLLEAKNGLSFLDILARRFVTYREKRNLHLPVVFMNSFSTEADTLEALSSYENLKGVIPLTFLQHKFPKVLQEGFRPVSWPANPDLEWNPPGHGDIYTALVTSGLLERLLNHGLRYAFISNTDNLGAVVDETILGYFAKNNFPFMMEVTERTGADRKGGHLARLKNGRLILREIAQCPAEERGQFQDVNLYRYFNTNSIWINLLSVKRELETQRHVIHLPMIRNPKALDPRDESTPPVYQLETAMGSAISVFKGAAAIRVPRNRFAPVKKGQDLLAVWSDCYILTEDYFVLQNPKRTLGTLMVKLDDRYYGTIDQLRERFPHGAPSLLHCESLEVEGDVRFGKGIAVKNKVVVTNRSGKQRSIEDGTVIEKDFVFTQ